MSAINRTTLQGNLGHKPELRYTKNGRAVTNFSLATNRQFKDAEGNQQKAVEWNRITVWGKQAENCCEYLEKGAFVTVEGRLQTNFWEDKEGQKRSTKEVVATNIQFHGRPQEKEGNIEAPESDAPPAEHVNV